ncbi:MAG: hypothetical protein Q7Q71_07150 [Verrucomicrobiota bacterium JB023]|nr:hypothetical protein [Verrucomicrobiota bacterium JB023]
MSKLEEFARINIDAQHASARRSVQNKNELNLSASPDVAVREQQSLGGPADYALFVEGKRIDVVKAHTTSIDHLEAGLDRKITRASRLRQSTLASAFAGTLIE